MLAPAISARFFAKALLGFVLLLSLASWVRYPVAFRAVAHVFFGTFGAHRIAQFARFDDPAGMLDTRIGVGTDARGAPEILSSIGINSVREGFAPAAVFLSLVIATPLPWRDKRRMLLVGLALVHVFVALRLAVVLAYGFSRVGVGPRPLLDVGMAGTRVFHRLDQIVSEDLHSTYIAPAIVWLLLASGKPQWPELWRRTSSPAR